MPSQQAKTEPYPYFFRTDVETDEKALWDAATPAQRAAWKTLHSLMPEACDWLHPEAMPKFLTLSPKDRRAFLRDCVRVMNEERQQRNDELSDFVNRVAQSPLYQGGADAH